MIKVDNESLVCDLAETYGIFYYKELPPFLVATLSVGLRENSRIKMKLSNSKIDSNQVLLAGILDCLRTLVWLNSSLGMQGLERPESILEKILGKEKDIDSFASAEDFENRRKEIITKIEERRTNGN